MNFWSRKFELRIWYFNINELTLIFISKIHSRYKKSFLDIKNLNFIQTIFWYLKIYIGYQELFSFFYIMKYQEIFFEISNSNYWFSNSLFDIRNASKILKPRHIRYSYHTHECNTLYLNNLVLDNLAFFRIILYSCTSQYHSFI